MARNTESQVKLAFRHLNNLYLPTYFDGNLKLNNMNCIFDD